MGSAERIQRMMKPGRTPTEKAYARLDTFSWSKKEGCEMKLDRVDRDLNLRGDLFVFRSLSLPKTP